jgi:hypothetical protein
MNLLFIQPKWASEEIPESKARSTRKAANLPAICEPIV